MAQTTKYIKLIGSFTRPNNTTQYATNDLINNDSRLPVQLVPENGITITSGQSLELKQVKIATDNDSDIIDINFNVLDDSHQLELDNDEQSITYQEIPNLVYIGGITLNPTHAISYGFINDINIPIKTEVNNLYCYLTLASATYTPIAKQNFYIEVLCALIDG